MQWDRKSGFLSNPRHLAVAAVVISLGGLALPFVGLALGLGDAAPARNTSIRFVGIALAVAAVAYLRTRGQPALSRARAFLLASLAMLVLGAALYRQDLLEQHAAKDFVRRYVAFVASAQEPLRAWEARYQRVDLAKVLTPAGLATPAGRGRGRSILEDQRKLLMEHRAIAAGVTGSVERFIQAEAPDDGLREDFLAVMASGLRQASREYSGFEGARLELAASMAEVLQWAEDQGDSLELRGEHIVFSTREQQQALMRLLQRHATIEKRHNELLAKAQAFQDASSERSGSAAARLEHKQ